MKNPGKFSEMVDNPFGAKKAEIYLFVGAQGHLTQESK
jgi:hypothetical protein